MEFLGPILAKLSYIKCRQRASPVVRDGPPAGPGGGGKCAVEHESVYTWNDGVCVISLWLDDIFKYIFIFYYFVLFTSNSMLSFLFYYVNLPKGELLVNLCVSTLIDWGRVTRICVGNITIIGSDNCLSPGRRHAIIWTDAGILIIGPSKTDFNEIIHFHSRKFENVPW